MKIINNFNEYLNLKSEYGLSKNANSDEMIKLIVWAFKKPNKFTNTKVCRCGNKFLYSWIKFNPNAWIQFKKGCRFFNMVWWINKLQIAWVLITILHLNAKNLMRESTPFVNASSIVCALAFYDHYGQMNSKRWWMVFLTLLDTRSY